LYAGNSSNAASNAFAPLSLLREPCYSKGHIHPITGNLNRLERKRNKVADTSKIEDKKERKALKRTARKKAAPKAKRTEPRGSAKKKVKKLARGVSKR
jgi:hypothetical protein